MLRNGPTEAMDALMSGKIQYDSAPDWLKSWASLAIYIKSRSIADAETLAERREILASVPVGIRPQVEEMAKDMFTKKRSKNI